MKRREVRPGRSRVVSSAFCALTMLCGSPCWAQSTTGFRSPLGVYAKVDIQDAINGYNGKAANLHTYLQGLYAGLLADPAISGLAVGAHWNKLQPSSGLTDGRFDWSDLDDVFAAATAAHKTIQLIATPGVDMPQWLVNELPSCDPLFTTGSAPSNCGTVTFVGYPQQKRAAQSMYPLPWNPVYQDAWD